MTRAGKHFGWREGIWAAVAVGCALVSYRACQTPEPARTALELVAAVCDGKASERKWLIDNCVAPELHFDGDEGQRSFTREELPRALAELRATRSQCELELLDWQIQPATSGGLWIQGTLSWSDSQPSDLHGRTRDVRALFSLGKDRGPWLERVIVGPIRRAEPEARP